MGSGLDIVSGGELYRGLKAGFSPDTIVYSGVGKREDEIDFALETGILMFNIESIQELELINQRAGVLGKRAPVAIRVNPDVDPQTHPYISTGLKKNKFGINTEMALATYRSAQEMENVDVIGIDCHIGSQITQVSPFGEALENLKEMAGVLEKEGIGIEYLDMGGGVGITYNEENPPALSEYAAVITELFKGLKLKLILEPGRVIVGNAGILVTRALYTKQGVAKNFVIVDAGMNDLLRPTLYQAWHGIQPVVQKDGEEITADVVGPICESGDFLAQDRELGGIDRGDLLAVMSAGAYGFMMASNYCSRLKVPEVMVRGDQFHVTKTRQEYEDLVSDESIPPFLET
jgi:diaminopimelate decarboxylase